MATPKAKTEEKVEQVAPEPETTVNENAPKDEGVEMIRKLSPKTIMGRVTIPLKPDKTPYVDEDGVPTKFPDTELYTCIGMAHGLKTGTGDNGPWVAFLGAFEAVRAKDGKRFQGGQCFVPKAVEDIMAASLRAAQAKDAGASVEFGIEVGIKFAANQIGYEYYVKNLVKTNNADPLESLRNRLTSVKPSVYNRPALAAPTK